MKRRPPTLSRHLSRRRLLLLFAAAFFAFSLSWNFSPRVASQSTEPHAQGIDLQPAGPENYDIRTSMAKAAQIKRERYQQSMDGERAQRKAVRGQQLKAARERLKTKGIRVEASEYMDAPAVVSVGKGARMRAAAGEPRDRVVRRFLAANESLYGLSMKQIGRLKTRAEYTNPAGNITWVSLEQSFKNIPVFQGELTAALTPDGELVHTSGALAPDVNEKGLDSTPAVAAQAAIASAAATVGVTVDPSELILKESSGTSYVFTGGPFTEETKIELVYFPLDSGVVALGWAMTIWPDPTAYYTVVDAEDGELLFRKNLTNDQTQTATYVVYGSDGPAPLSPLPLSQHLTATVPVIQGAAVGRDTFTLIHQHPSQNDPWLNDGANTTTGNNVDAGMDLVSPDGIDAGSRPVGAPFRVFDFPYNPGPGSPPPGDSPTLANYRFGEVVNMFYWTNRFHDITYGLGFTELARNFQQNNFGRGGVGNDRVLAQGQDFSGTDNANFLTPPDGTSGRMQMYIFTGPTPDRSSGLDQEIIIHELTHGLSNRLHANGAGLNFAQGGGMGEGWGDFFARAILSDASEDIGGIYATGGYSTQLIVTGYQNNYYYGIRRFPYALRTTLGANGRPHNPLTFADVDASKINLTDGAFPRGPIGSATAHAVHNVGEVWCMTLLEVRARLIALHGFAVGNQRAMQLAVDGMKLEPADPTMLNARDSILAASIVGGNAAEEVAVWEGFASRGMGFGATVSAASSAPITVGESFDTPNLTPGAITVTNDSCDFSGFADPGESIELVVPLTNNYVLNDAENVTAEIVGGGSASYGDIPAGGSATRNLTYTVPATANCGDKIELTININSSLGPVVKTYSLQVGAPTSFGPAVTAGTGNVTIPLPDVTTTEIPITVTDTGLVGDVNVRLRLNHTFDGDLEIRLVAPDGTAVLLADNRGGSGDNYGTGANGCSGVPTVFDDSAATAISAGVAPFAATFRPDQLLAGLNGKQMSGIWKIRITDTANADTGTLGCATLEIQPQLYFCCGVAGTPIINAAPPATVVAESAVPANNAPDPDETVTMSFPLRNVGTGLTTNLKATLLPGGGVNTPSGPQFYGAMSPIGPAVARDFTFVPSGTCGGDITATFHLEDGPLDLGNVTFTVRLGSTVVGGASGANATSIAIPGAGTGAGTGAPANPYPSAINISGVTGTVTKVTATLTGMSHTFPDDVDVLLVGPGGQKVILMSDAGLSNDLVNVNLTFDDSAATALSDSGAIPSGTYRPTNFGTGDSFPAPAPAAPFGSALSDFNGLNPNGQWRLFVVDDAGADVGSIAGGWSLNIVTADPFCVTSPCIINAPNVVQPNDAGACGAFANFPTPTIQGSCGVISYAPPSGSFFPVGLTSVVVTGTRQDSSTTTSSCTVTINDTELPSIGGGTVSRASLWPANHKMVDVAVNYTVGDNCTDAGAIMRSLSVASNEPVNGTGDGDTAPDWQVAGPNLVRLRAERSGNGTGRIYTITITATDQYNNTTTKNVQVVVPHNQ